MTSPNITEALEPCPFCTGKGRLYQSQNAAALWRVCCENCDAGPRSHIGHEEAIKRWNTRATLQPSSERREAIAPLRTRLADLIHQNYEPAPEGFPETEPWNGGALDIVDMIIEEILASGLVRDEVVIRRDEREKCAELADLRYEPVATEIAAAIRSASDIAYSQDGDCGWLMPSRVNLDDLGISNGELQQLRDARFMGEEPSDEDEHYRFGPPDIITDLGRAALAQSVEKP